MTSKLVVNTIEADTGISSVSFASSISMSSTSKFHFGDAGIDIGADTNINRPAAGVLGFNINNTEKLRIDSNGHLNTSGIATASNFKTGSSNLHSTGLTVGNNFLHTTGINVGTGATIHVPASNTLTFGTNSNERLRITSDGSIGINATTPSAGDMASGASFAAPKLHVLGNNTQSGAYELLARFQSGTDADNTGATIVLNHANDRGLAIQGGRRTGNYAHGALKMVDNVGRLSNAMLIHGGAGQGVNHMGFYTGESTTTTERCRITATGDFNTYHDTNDEGIFVRNTANNAAIRIYASGGSPSGAYRIAHNGPTDALQIDRTNTSGAYSDIVLGFYSNRTWKRAPIGTVIQVVYGRYDPNTDTYSVIAQDTKARSPAYVDITPLRSDSKLLIQSKCHTRMQNSPGCSFGIDYSTNSGSSWTALTSGMVNRGGASLDFFYKGESLNHHYTGSITTYIDSFTGTRRFSPWGQGWGSGTWELSYGHGEHSVTIFEIAT